MSFMARRVAARLLAAARTPQHVHRNHLGGYEHPCECVPEGTVVVRRESIEELARELGVVGFTWDGAPFYAGSPYPVLRDGTVEGRAAVTRARHALDALEAATAAARAELDDADRRAETTAEQRVEPDGDTA